MSQPAPNPQTNLILQIVTPVVALIAIAILYFTRPVPVAPPAPAAVNTTAAKLPDAGVTLANQLPGGGSATGGVGGAPGAMGGPPGVSAGAGGGRAPMGGPPGVSAGGGPSAGKVRNGGGGGM